MSYPQLDHDQLALLLSFSETQEATPKAQRDDFYFLRSFGDSGHVQHKGLPGGQLPAYRGDIDLLVETGLLKQTRRFDGGLGFIVSPSGIAYSRTAREAQGEPSERIENEVRRWLSADAFIRRYPEVHGRWVTAEKLLASVPNESRETTIGHLCREALQLFTDALVERYTPPNASPTPSHTVNRLRAVVQSAPSLGNTPRAFVDSLIGYWGALNDLVQRQEHGALREQESLSGEDSRRVVFYTFLVMFEVDRLLTK